MTPADFYAFEKNLNAAFSTLLNEGGYPVVPLFIPQDALAAVPNRACFVSSEFADLDESVLSLREIDGVGIVSEPTGYSSLVEITHRVPISDDPDYIKAGGPYPLLLSQRGEIRALVLHNREKLNAYLRYYDILSLTLAAPRQSVNREKFAHEATETFRIRYTARGQIPS